MELHMNDRVCVYNACFWTALPSISLGVSFIETDKNGKNT
jgi:hypothetical protein